MKSGILGVIFGCFWPGMGAPLGMANMSDMYTHILSWHRCMWLECESRLNMLAALYDHQPSSNWKKTGKNRRSTNSVVLLWQGYSPEHLSFLFIEVLFYFRLFEPDSFTCACNIVVSFTLIHLFQSTRLALSFLLQYTNQPAETGFRLSVKLCCPARKDLREIVKLSWYYAVPLVLSFSWWQTFCSLYALSNELNIFIVLS